MEAIRNKFTSIPIEGAGYGWIRYLGAKPSGLKEETTAVKWAGPMLDARPNQTLTYEVDIMVTGFRKKDLNILGQGYWLLIPLRDVLRDQPVTDVRLMEEKRSGLVPVAVTQIGKFEGDPAQWERDHYGE